MLVKCTEMHYVLFKTRAGVLYNEHICRLGESGIGRTDGGWKFPELTERSEVGLGNPQPPELRPIPDSPNLQVCLVFSTDEFTHFSV